MKRPTFDHQAAAQMAREGKSIPDIATAFGKKYMAVYKALYKLGIRGKREIGERSPRRQVARELKQAGLTYAQIGEQLGISRQRAQQLVSPTERVLKNMRDGVGNRCQNCGKKCKKLDAHHEDYSASPTRILCSACHKTADKAIGSFATPKRFQDFWLDQTKQAYPHLFAGLQK